jgi:cell division protein FtsA
VDVGGGTTDIAIFTEGAIRHTAVIPIAGDQVTNDIAMALRTPTQYAEEIKIRYACALAKLAGPGETIKVPSVGDRPPRELSRQALAEVVEPRYDELFTLVQAELRRSGQRIALLAFGSPLAPALEAATELDATVVNMRFVKPLDAAMIARIAATHELLVTLEENVVAGGAGSAVNECLSAMQLPTPVLNMGLPDRFIEHGTVAELLSECGLDRAGIVARINEYLQQHNCAATRSRLIS